MCIEIKHSNRLRLTYTKSANFILESIPEDDISMNKQSQL